MNIVYLHGLSSSGNSNTASKLRELLPDDNVITPDIPVEPDKALTLIHSIVDRLPKEDTLIIGTSMGAMYAQQISGYRRILVNPAFHVSELLRDNEGETLPFFSQRQDGATEFSVTPELCEHFEEMEAGQFENANRDDNLIALFGNQDTTCNCFEEYTRYYQYYHRFNGGHRMNDQIIVGTILPLIEWMKRSDKGSRHEEEVITPFKDIKRGDTGYYKRGRDLEDQFKVYHKGIGRVWFDEIYKECNGMTLPDGRVAELTFPELPAGVDPETAALVLGNRFGQAPTVEYYDPEGVEVIDNTVFYANGIKIEKAE